jgi:UDP-N-acetylglucosamine 2-epimerase (non-hydrolysing)
MRNVLSIFGTRPEAIKLAPVLLELAKYPDDFRSIVCVTAQHREMLDQVLRIFDVQPHLDLDLMTENQTLPGLTSTALLNVTAALEQLRPDIVLVQGDTTSAMAAGLAAFYRKVPVGHVEAGLRTGDPYQPFPEEINRRLISSIATYHFAPTETARAALLREGVSDDAVLVTGNTVVDALQTITRTAHASRSLESLGTAHRLILVTAHRREHFGGPLENICRAIVRIVEENSGVEIAYPVHPNPNVRATVERMLRDKERIHLLPPLEYDQFIHVLSRSIFVLTDSGGVQEEGPVLGKPVLVMRDTTERPEGLAAGSNRLVGTRSEQIVAEAQRLLNDPVEYASMARQSNPFGDGHAAERIVSFLKSVSSKSVSS